jgi:hypothetical protein
MNLATKERESLTDFFKFNRPISDIKWSEIEELKKSTPDKVWSLTDLFVKKGILSFKPDENFGLFRFEPTKEINPKISYDEFNEKTIYFKKKECAEKYAKDMYYNKYTSKPMFPMIIIRYMNSLDSVDSRNRPCKADWIEIEKLKYQKRPNLNEVNKLKEIIDSLIHEKELSFEAEGNFGLIRLGWPIELNPKIPYDGWNEKTIYFKKKECAEKYGKDMFYNKEGLPEIKSPIMIINYLELIR